jgi:hypothetical protein
MGSRDDEPKVELSGLGLSKWTVSLVRTQRLDPLENSAAEATLAGRAFMGSCWLERSLHTDSLAAMRDLLEEPAVEERLLVG